MKAEELFSHAFSTQGCKLTNTIVEEDIFGINYIQYFYSIGDNNYFLRIGPMTLINGRIDEDGKSYASGVSMTVLKCLLANYQKVRG